MSQIHAQELTDATLTSLSQTYGHQLAATPQVASQIAQSITEELKKIASVENLKAAAQAALDLFLDANKSHEDKVTEISVFLLSNASALNGLVTTIPTIGAIVGSLLASDTAKNLEKEVCDKLAESVVTEAEKLTAKPA